MKDKYIEEFEEQEGLPVEELEQQFEDIMRVKERLTDKYGFEVGFWEARTHYFLDKIENQIDEAKRELHIQIFEQAGGLE
jgi:hypothetical protein